ncbi:uncharacterized protein K02A2.6-like, partial [Stegodyphus dumicola]|uniref:uncharacterized protein K02A2.6-like n=1 Tax=Stegodyphus dumicola TaxID=202533 RepID=UPI0015B04DF0
MCRLKHIQNVSQHDNADVYSESDDEFFVNSINVQKTKSVCSTSSTKEWTKTIIVEGTTVTFKLDTGSEVNVLPVKTYETLSAKNSNLILNKCNVVLEAFGGSKVKPDGSLMLQCSSDGVDHTLEFLIVSSKHIRPLLGIDACVKLNLIQFINKVGISIKGKLDQYTIVLPPSKDQFIINNSEVFEGVGKFNGLCKIMVDDQIAPVVRPPRRVPLSLKPKLELKLSELERQGIIAKVDQPLNWVSNLVIIEKANGSLRICLDPQDLNKAIKREHVLIPTIEEILPKLCNKSIYSVLDLKDGFFQIALDGNSSDLCTFSTPFGCYKFLRLPMGISCAPEIFQKRNLENFGDIPGVLVYFDDILIAASTIQEHDKNFNRGMRPDPDRIKAITELQEPQNKHELQRVLGMCNYLRKFVPHFSEKTAILRELLKNKVEWQWLQLHSKAFRKKKKLISNAPVLGIFDSSKPITIQADSSKDGFRPQTVKEPLVSHEIPSLPCEKVGADICDWKMKSFARDWGFEIITSSPRYPKSNGFAERLVGIAKSLFRKAGLEKLNEALLEYRNTPISGINLSPSQMLLSRNLRTRLPITQTELKPTVKDQYREK